MIVRMGLVLDCYVANRDPSFVTLLLPYFERGVSHGGWIWMPYLCKASAPCWTSLPAHGLLACVGLPWAIPSTAGAQVKGCAGLVGELRRQLMPTSVNWAFALSSQFWLGGCADCAQPDMPEAFPAGDSPLVQGLLRNRSNGLSTAIRDRSWHRLKFICV